MANTNPTKGMTAEQKAQFKASKLADYRVKAAEVTEALAATKVLRDQQGEIVDDIVAAFGPGPYKIDGKIVKARKEGKGHHQFHSQDPDAIPEL